MYLSRLLTFHEAAEALNFSIAAQKLSITQPAVSAQIRNLEEDLGVKLFTRIGKKIALSEAGELLRSYSRRIYRLLDDAESVMNELRLVRRGTLKVGTTPTYAGHIMPPLLSKFQAEFPLVKVILNEGSSLDITKRVAKLEIEVAVVAYPGNLKNVQFDLLGQEDLVLVVSPDHSFASRKSISIKSLAKENFIMREKGSSTRLMMNELFRRHRINPSVVFETSNAEFIKEQVATGMGISFLTRSAVSEELASGRLATAKLQEEELKLEIYSAVRMGHELSQPARAFLNIVAKD
jgi:LysR family transcriptional regulator, low CO2-responsive transcriptional regulator